MNVREIGLQEKTLKDFDRAQMANVPEFRPKNDED
jgi:hypothetical protein